MLSLHVSFLQSLSISSFLSVCVSALLCLLFCSSSLFCSALSSALLSSLFLFFLCAKLSLQPAVYRPNIARMGETLPSASRGCASMRPTCSSRWTPTSSLSVSQHQLRSHRAVGLRVRLPTLPKALQLRQRRGTRRLRPMRSRRQAPKLPRQRRASVRSD